MVTKKKKWNGTQIGINVEFSIEPFSVSSLSFGFDSSVHEAHGARGGTWVVCHYVVFFIYEKSTFPLTIRLYRIVYICITVATVDTQLFPLKLLLTLSARLYRILGCDMSHYHCTYSNLLKSPKLSNERRRRRRPGNDCHCAVYVFSPWRRYSALLFHLLVLFISFLAIKRVTFLPRR